MLSNTNIKLIRGFMVGLILCVSSLGVAAQRERYWDGQRFTRLLPGMTISVRTNEPVDAARLDYRVYTGVVQQDVRGDNGRLAIPRGSQVELMARRARNNELVLDVESVVVNGQRYAIGTDAQRIVGTSGVDSLVGSILGEVTGGRVRGPDVRLPRNSVLNFRLDRSLEMGVADRGVSRDGYHYHDFYRRD